MLEKVENNLINMLDIDQNSSETQICLFYSRKFWAYFFFFVLLDYFKVGLLNGSIYCLLLNLF